MRAKEIDVRLLDPSVVQQIDKEKVLVLILDGQQGRAKLIEAVEHGYTVIETVKGQVKRVKYEESELF